MSSDDKQKNENSIFSIKYTIDINVSNRINKILRLSSLKRIFSFIIPVYLVLIFAYFAMGEFAKTVCFVLILIISCLLILLIIFVYADHIKTYHINKKETPFSFLITFYNEYIISQRDNSEETTTINYSEIKSAVKYKNYRFIILKDRKFIIFNVDALNEDQLHFINSKIVFESNVDLINGSK